MGTKLTKIWSILLLLAVCTLPLYGENEPQNDTCDFQPVSLVNFTAAPSTIVNGCVNIISGDLVDASCEMKLSGPDGYMLGHSYVSSFFEKGNLAQGWTYLHNHKLKILQPEGINFTKELPISPEALNNLIPKYHGHGKHIHGSPLYKEKNSKTCAYLYEPSGGKMYFKGDGWAQNFKLILKNTGLTNTGSGAISGQTNLKNIKLERSSFHDTFRISTGNGTVRTYSRKEKRHKRVKPGDYHYHVLLYRITKEELPSGNVVLYTYDSSNQISTIRVKNKNEDTTLSWVKFSYATAKGSPQKRVCLKTSDKRKVVFIAKKLKDTKNKVNAYVVTQILRPGLPSQKFSYSEESDNHDLRVVKKSLQTGFFLETRYYKKGKNTVGKAKMVNLDTQKRLKFIRNRVRHQYSPVGVGQKTILTHKFFYRPKNSDGLYHTTNHDAYNNKTHFFYDKDKRLKILERYNGNDDLIMQERFVFGSKGREKKGNLLARTIYDENKRPIFSREYTYDTHGNVTTEKLFGHFTQKKGKLKVDSDGNPSSSSTCDCLVFQRKYSKDGLNLLLKEIDPRGLKTIYKYKKGTNLVIAKFTKYKEQIFRREFFKYDSNAVLKKHICDDGISKDRNEITGIRVRSIKRIKPRTKSPHFGEPEVIEESFYDMVEKREKLVLRTENSFSERGMVIGKRIYDAEKQLVAKFSFKYDNFDRMTYSKDPIGREVFFSWDEFGRMTKKKGPRLDYSTHYSYDLCGQLIKEKEIHDSGLILSTHYEYDYLGRKVAMISPQGHKTCYAYDAIGRVLKIKYPELVGEKDIKEVPTKRFTYKKFCRIVEATDELGHKTIIRMSAFGKPLLEIFPDGTQKQYDYDLQGNLIREVAQNLVVTENKYDKLSRLVSTTLKSDNEILFSKSMEYGQSLLLKEETITSEAVEFSYDYCGRVVETKKLHPGSQKVKRSCTYFDAQNRIIEERAYTSENTYIANCKKYDQVNRVIQESVDDQSGRIHSIASYAYDDEDNVCETTTFVQNQICKTSMKYLPHKLLAKTKDAEGNSTHFYYDHFHVTERGQKVLKKKTIDAQGSTTIDEIDHRGLTLSTATFDPFEKIVAMKQQRFDAIGNCIRTLDFSVYQGSVEKVIHTCFDFGPCQKLMRILEAKGELEQKVTSFTYNRFGQLEEICRSDKTSVYHTYDQKGRVSHYWSSDNTIDFTYDYDISDNILSVTNGLSHEKTCRSYDEFGLLNAEVLETGFRTEYSTDLLDRVQKIMLFDQSAIEYSYSPLHVQEIRRISKNQELQWTHTINDRDLSGQINQQTFLNDIGTLTYTYDVLCRLKKMEHPLFSEEIPQNGYDSVGNLLSINTKDPQGEFLSSYAYDYLHQLTQENGHEDHDYVYDSLFNRRKIDQKDYRVNCLHSLLSDSDNTYEYDSFGNRLAKYTDTNTIRYTYDALDRMTSFEIENEIKVNYDYDAFHRRIRKTTFRPSSSGWDTGAEERYLYIDDREIGMVNEDGKICQLRVLGEGLGAEIGASVAFELYDQLFVPLHDHRGNVTVLLDGSNGEVVETYRYSSFGVETIFDDEGEVSNESDVYNPWRFSSKRVDSESGYVYFGRRYYDPEVGRWLTQDPLGVKAGPNLYAYVRNCPLTNFDLYGLLEEEIADQSQQQDRPQERSIFERAVDTVCDVVRSVFQGACKFVAEVARNALPLGNLSDKIADVIYKVGRMKPPEVHHSGLHIIQYGKSDERGRYKLILNQNGMMCTLDEAIENSMEIAKIYPNAYVILMYNASHGFMNDFLESALNICGVSTNAVKVHEETMNNFVRLHEGSWLIGKIINISHSQGGIISHLGERNIKNVDNHIKHISFGSTHLFKGGVNIVDRTDLVTFFSHITGFFKGLTTNRTLIKFVGPIFSLPCSNHSFKGKSYLKALQDIPTEMIYDSNEN